MSDLIVDKARKIIATNHLMILVTSRGKFPYIAPSIYVVDEEYNFYFNARIGRIHAENIKSNKKAAAAIFDSTLSSKEADGIQMAAIVTHLNEGDEQRVIDLIYCQLNPTDKMRMRLRSRQDDFTGKTMRRFLKLIPNEIYKLDNSITHIDRRIQINIKELKSIPAKPY